MSVILEFTVDSDQFWLGRELSRAGNFEFELERIVPTGNLIMPFVWVATDDDPGVVLPDFENRLRESSRVHEILVLDKVDDGGLYRIESEGHEDGIIKALSKTEATVLESWGTDNWTFRVRFNDHDRLTEFHNILTDSDITIHIERTYTFSSESARRRDFGLTPNQREALVLGLERGYFATPKEVDLDVLADELRISEQAVSDRIQRGNEKILQPLLLPSVTDFQSFS